MHVVQMNPLTAQGAAQGFAGKDLYDAQVKYARTRLEHYVQRMPAAVRRELIGEIGELGILIVASQQWLRAELAVMGAHGRRRLKHIVLSSAAERIVHASTAPVLMMRAAGG